MSPCDGCRRQLLPYHYDLLGDDERATLRGHLDSCPECRAELEAAREQQQLFAAAVKEEFGDVRFAPPALAPPAAPRAALWRSRWLIAAAVLVGMFGGLGTLVGVAWHGQVEAAQEAEERLAEART